MKTLKTLAALCALIASLLGCGGGGSESTAPPPTAGPSPAEIAAEVAESTRLLRAHMDQRMTQQTAVYQADNREIKFRLFAQGLVCGSVHREELVALARRHAFTLDESAELMAGQLAASRRWCAAAFTVAFADFRQSQILLLASSDTCPTAFLDSLSLQTLAALDEAFALTMGRLRQRAIVT